MNAPDKIAPRAGDEHPAVASFNKHFERDRHFGWTPVGYWKGGWNACAAQTNVEAPGPEETAPAALHGLLRRLLEDHQRIMPHNAELCPLCQDAERTLDLLADEVPDDASADSNCPQQAARQSNP